MQLSAIYASILGWFLSCQQTSCNISKPSVRFGAGCPDTEKQVKVRGRRPSAFTVSRCLEIPLKHDARVFDLASKNFRTSAVIRAYCFSALISHEIMYLRNNQNVGNLLLSVVSHVGVKMAESSAANTVSRFCSPKTG